MTWTRAFTALVLALIATIALSAQSAHELYERGLVQEHANGDLQSALALYSQAAQAAGNDRAVAARALRRLAGVHEKLGRDAEAASVYAQLVRAYPEQRTEVAAAESRLAALRLKTSAGAPAARAVTATDPRSLTGSFLDTYCTNCHNGRTKAAGLDLESAGRAPVAVNTPLWEKVTRRLLAHRDPPIGLPRPDPATYTSVVSRLERALDAAYADDRTLMSAERVSDMELASRIAMFLWSGQPDAPLLEAARRGELRDEAQLRRQVARMLRDPRSAALANSFFARWLSLDRIKSSQPARAGATVDSDLLDAMDTETRLFVQSQLREDHDAVELWTANYTYVNERLARHYGLPGIIGREFRRVTLPGPSRAGLLGQAGPLTALSSPGRTSPTRRGVYVLTRFLGIDAPNPPANVPPLAEGAAPLSGTLRDRLTAHRTSPSCANCHALFDPLGFGLENFDATGAWRIMDGEAPVNASGTFLDGTPFNGPAELRNGLLNYRGAYYRTVTGQLMAYALNRQGRRSNVYDYEMSAVRQIVREAAAQNHRWSSILAGICASVPFQMKAVVP